MYVYCFVHQKRRRRSLGCRANNRMCLFARGCQTVTLHESGGSRSVILMNRLPLLSFAADCTQHKEANHKPCLGCSHTCCLRQEPQPHPWGTGGAEHSRCGLLQGSLLGAWQIQVLLLLPDQNTYACRQQYASTCMHACLRARARGLVGAQAIVSIRNSASGLVLKTRSTWTQH